MSDDSDPFGAALADKAAQDDDSSADPFGAALSARAVGKTFKAPDDKSVAGTKEKTEGVTGFINGAAELAGKGILSIPYGAAHGVRDLWNYETGAPPSADPAWLDAIKPELSENAKSVAQSIAGTSAGKTAASVARAAQTAEPDLYRVGTDVAGILPATEAASGVAGAAGRVGEALTADGTRVAAAGGNAQAAIDAAYAAKSQGAAAVGVKAADLSPATQAEIARLGAQGITPNVDALERIKKAESVGLKDEKGLTAGQAQQDMTQMSDEFNRKGEQDNAIGVRYGNQQKQLSRTVADLHQEMAPTAVANSEGQNGQAIIESLKRYGAPKQAAIDAAYDHARSLNGGELYMDGKDFATRASSATEDMEGLIPAEAQRIIDRQTNATKPYSLTQFETDRTVLARARRKYEAQADGNATAAIDKVRDELEKTAPMGDSAAAAKKAYDKARGLASADFEEQRNTPAYGAARADDTAEGELSPLADTFTEKYLHSNGETKGARANVQNLVAKLDDEGRQAVTSSAFSKLRKASDAAGGFQPNQFNGALSKINAKPELIGDADALEKLRDVNEVSSWIDPNNLESYKNRSHSFVAAAKEWGAKGAEGVVNAAAFSHGIPIPVGSAGRAVLAGRAAKKSMNEILKPGAGLGQ